MAPLNGGPERLMTRLDRAASAREQAKPVGQAIEDLFRREDSRPDRGKLDRQRQAVEPTAQAGNRSLVDGGQLVPARCCRRSGRSLPS